MIKNIAYFSEFEKRFISRQKLPVEQAFALLDAMWEEAAFLGVTAFSNPFDGIESRIKIARVLNTCLKKS